MLAMLWTSDNLGHVEKILFYQVSLKDFEGQSNILCPFLWIVSEFTTSVTQKSIFIISIDISLQNSKKEKSKCFFPNHYHWTFSLTFLKYPVLSNFFWCRLILGRNRFSYLDRNVWLDFLTFQKKLCLEQCVFKDRRKWD